MARMDEQQQLINTNLNAKDIADRKTDELVGICRGLIADNTVNKEEAKFLMQWIESNKERAPIYPFSILYKRLSEMLEDNILDEDEQSELLDILTKITGGDTLADNIESMSTTLPLSNPAPDITINGNTFVFTGVFNSGARKDLEQLVKDLGGHVGKSVTKSTNCLVIGEIGSKDWKHSSFGRKIEKAVQYRDELKVDISIVMESHWIKYV